MEPVYNGYDEQFLNGKQLKEFFEDCFLQTKHKQTCVLNMTIDEYLTFFNIEDDKLYRIFENGTYCRLSDGETDKEIMDAVIKSEHSYAEIMAFIKGEDVE